MAKRLDEKIVLITGGGTGIGAAIAELFSIEGATSIVIGRRIEQLSGVVDAISKKGNKAAFFELDITKEADVRKTINHLISTYGTIDVLINNAGIINNSPEDVYNTDWDEVRQVLDINLYSTISLTNYVLTELVRANKKGVIVNIASICAHRACADYPVYAASKGAILSYTRSIAAKYAHHFIRVNSISPGVIHTPMSYVEMKDFDTQIQDLNEMHPLGRIGRPKDIANAALFLASDEAEWITGQDLIVDGGWLLRE